jgi:predicted PurR-regulated permease PerM
LTIKSETQRRIELWGGVAALVFLIAGCFIILEPFITSILWAAILCLCTWPIYTYVGAMIGGRRSLAALVMVLGLSAVIVAPFLIVGMSLAQNATEVVAAIRQVIDQGPPAPPAWLDSIPLVGGSAHDYWISLSRSSSVRIEEFGRLLPMLRNAAVGGASAIVGGILQISLSLIIAFFLYRDGDTAARRLSDSIARIAGEEGRRLLDVAGDTTRAVLYGILGTALAQGSLAAIGFWIAGVPGVFLLGFCSFLVSILPMGPPLIWIPASIWLFTQGSTFWGVFLLVWGTLVVSSVDNFLKPILISRGGTTPLIIVMLGVLGGALAFGFIGIFLGPTLLAAGYSLLIEWSSISAETVSPS